GSNGYPDGTDTCAIDRTANLGGSSRLTNAGNTIGTVAGVTGTGTGDQDIVFKHGGANTIGDLTLLASAAPFHIREERDQSLTIDGVISGEGDLLMTRDGGFSDGVDPDELITITGTEPNTITGTIRLWNSNNKAAPEGQPCYWVADKVGAFGQTSELTLEGRAGTSGGIASLRITANTVGGEGAIDDDATVFNIGAKGVLNIDAGVNEKVGEGNLWIDPEGTGSYTEVAPGTYTNTEAWIEGDGSITVGASSILAITEIDLSSDLKLALTWNSNPGRIYSVYYSLDMIDWGADLDDGVVGDDGETTTREFDLSAIPALDGVPRVYFRVEQ
ncbi:MAG: hypothetical protein P8P32_02830, partial [Akkermansiaceae bacterium]|nr:hypothetical protein [Akkermansiaceae bacterium]